VRQSRFKIGDYVYAGRKGLKGEVVHILPDEEKVMVKISISRSWPKAYGYGKSTSYFTEVWPENELAIKCELTECFYDDGEL
jgi:hypothetical protein